MLNTKPLNSLFHLCVISLMFTTTFCCEVFAMEKNQSKGNISDFTKATQLVYLEVPLRPNSKT